MKLNQAFEYADACGLKTIGEAVSNIELHACNLFKYEDLAEEISELRADRDRVYDENGYSDSTLITVAFDHV